MYDEFDMRVIASEVVLLGSGWITSYMPIYIFRLNSNRCYHEHFGPWSLSYCLHQWLGGHLGVTGARVMQGWVGCFFRPLLRGVTTPWIGGPKQC